MNDSQTTDPRKALAAAYLVRSEARARLAAAAAALDRGRRIEQDGRDVHPRDPIHERVVRLGDQGKATILQPLHQPQLPQRLGPVQRL